jgi:hypothetical protein
MATCCCTRHRPINNGALRVDALPLYFSILLRRALVNILSNEEGGLPLATGAPLEIVAIYHHDDDGRASERLKIFHPPHCDVFFSWSSKASLASSQHSPRIRLGAQLKMRE